MTLSKHLPSICQDVMHLHDSGSTICLMQNHPKSLPASTYIANLPQVMGWLTIRNLSLFNIALLMNYK